MVGRAVDDFDGSRDNDLSGLRSIEERVVGPEWDFGLIDLMMQSASQFRVPLMFAAVFVIVAMGIGTYVIFAVLESRLTGWATLSLIHI